MMNGFVILLIVTPFSIEVKDQNGHVIKSIAPEDSSERTTLENNNEYVQEYISNEGFPEGEYTIEVTADFYTIVDTEKKESYKLNTSVDIDVKE